MQHRIENPSPLLNKEGLLNQEGYATDLLLSYNKRNIKASPLRIKEWDYYYILDSERDFALTFTISDLGYLGLSAVAWIDLAAGRFCQADELSLFPLGKTGLNPDSRKGDVFFRGKKLSLSFSCQGNKRFLRAGAPDLEAPTGGQGFTCELELEEEPEAESMVIATSWKENRRAFYYNQKINCFKVSGRAVLGDREYLFSPQTCSGGLDWGRGVWTYKNRWFWSSASGNLKGVPFGFNLGYGFSDRSPASENMIFYNYKAHKLEDVTFYYNAGNYLEPWEIRDNQGRLSLDFQPSLDRFSKTDFCILKSVQHQVFGHFSGSLFLDTGEEIRLQRFPGFTEDVLNWW